MGPKRFKVGFAAFAALLALIGSAGAAAQPAALPLDLGGPFALVDHTGRAVSDEDFRGRFMLVFFGYANCPGICPTGLRAMTEALDILGEKGERVVPLLITVDPKDKKVKRWFENDPQVNALIARDGKLGLGLEADQKYLEAQ